MVVVRADHPFAALRTGKRPYVLEHRLVMSETLGRPLTRFEHVHHLNGIKTDNRPENLELVNGASHRLITHLETRIRSLEAELAELRAR